MGVRGTCSGNTELSVTLAYEAVSADETADALTKSVSADVLTGRLRHHRASMLGFLVRGRGRTSG